MKESKESIENLRNIGIIAHGGAGKTTLAEAMLFDSGAIDRLGKVDKGTCTMDFEPEEIKRSITISSSFHHYQWKKYRINIIDTPGDDNFLNDARMCLQAADGVVIVIDAIDGVKAQTEKVWGFADEFNLPRIVFINKMDRERADFYKVLQDIQSSFKSKVIPVQIPIGSEASFKGLIDLIHTKSYIYSNGLTGKFEIEDVSSNLPQEATTYQNQLMEHIAETSDELIEKYLEGKDLSMDEIEKGLRKGVLSRQFVLLCCGSALKNIGIQPLLDLINLCLPSPADRGLIIGEDPKTREEKKRRPDSHEPFSGLVFKTIADPYAGRLTIFRVYSGTLKSDSTVYNSTKGEKERFGQILVMEGKGQKPVPSASVGDIVAIAKLKETTTGDTLCDEKDPIVYTPASVSLPVISYAIEPKTKGDEEKIISSITRLLEEDPTLRLRRSDETKEIILSGMGQIHIEVAIEKLKRKFGVDVNLKTPKVPYRETIKGKARVQGKYKRQTGGRGQYGDVWIEIEPLPKGKGFEFVDKIVGGVIPKQYIPAVEKGIVEAMECGVLAGYKVTDIKITLVDGSFHEVDSSDMAFKIAGSMAFKKGFLQAQPILLEPIMKVTVTVPDECMGDVIGDLNSRRGRVLGMEAKGRQQVISAQVPMAEILKYALDLTSMTGGRGSFTTELLHYEEVPAHLSEKIIAQSKSHQSP
ncbi:MAG TPA: elongation factor G [Syntrophaceae bacterium]|nr:elongation factor G [Syntrophaceae bacterium]